MRYRKQIPHHDHRHGPKLHGGGAKQHYEHMGINDSLIRCRYLHADIGDVVQMHSVEPGNGGKIHREEGGATGVG